MTKLRRMLEEWMGIAPVAPGEDTQWHLRYDLGWPDWAVVLFALFAVAFVIGIYLREGTGITRHWKLVLAGIRLALVLLVVLMLGELELVIDRTSLPYLVFMIDDSESMAVRDRPPAGTSNNTGTGNKAPETRFAKVTEWLSRNEGRELRALTDRHKLQFHVHGNGTRLLGQESYIKSEEIPTLLALLEKHPANGPKSLLGSNLRSVLNGLRGTPPSSVVVVTDGVTTEGESLLQAAQFAARKNIPIFTIGAGDPERPRDLKIHDLLVDDTVFVEDDVTFEAKLTGQGFEGRNVAVALEHNQEPEQMENAKIKVEADNRAARVRLSHRPKKPGTYIYTLSVPVLDREADKDNNKITRAVRVIDEKIRVLYVESYPRYEFRYLKHLLEREPTIDVKVLLLDADPDYVKQDRVAMDYFPTDEKELFKFDVIILGDVRPNFFTQAQQEQIRQFVRVKGGGLLVIAGKSYVPQAYRDTVLENLLPVQLGVTTSESTQTGNQSFSLQLTLEGRVSPIFRLQGDEDQNQNAWNALPKMYWYGRSEGIKPAAQVLAELPHADPSQRAPLVVTQFFGAGRTYYQAFDATWRWRYRAEDYFHARYWVQTIRFLSRAKLLGKNRLVELLVDPPQSRRGEPVQLRLRFLDETLIPPKGEKVELRLQRGQEDERVISLQATDHRDIHEGVFMETRDGRYQVRLSNPLIVDGPTAEFLVVPPPGELDRVQMNEGELQEIAKITGGAYFALADADRLFSKLPPGRRVALHTDPPFPLWQTWPTLLFFVVLLTAEWLIRKYLRLL